jgi:hypothetical protein
MVETKKCGISISLLIDEFGINLTLTLPVATDQWMNDCFIMDKKIFNYENCEELIVSEIKVK